MNHSVLITGKHGYIGENLYHWLDEKETFWCIETLSLRNDEWKEVDFNKYDVIIHTVGVAHQQINNENRHLYYSINCDLAVDLAKHAKQSGVKHFIYISSMSVYSDSETVIYGDTIENPDNDYGKGKLLAENKLKELEDDNFWVSIVRPPMVYGKGCKGNYNKLRKISLSIPIFPKVNNYRSMIYIDNLSEFIRQIILSECHGLFQPQNRELVNTSNWVAEIAKVNGHQIYLSSLLGKMVMIGLRIIRLNVLQKAFGSSYYEPSISRYENINYQIVSFEESIKKTEGKVDECINS